MANSPLSLYIHGPEAAEKQREKRIGNDSSVTPFFGYSKVGLNLNFSFNCKEI